MRFIILLVLTSLLASCGLLPVAQPTPLPSATVPAVSPAASEPAVTPPAAVPVEPTAIPPTAEPTASPEPSATLPVGLTGSEARQATARELVEIVPPVRDDVSLAAAYRGIDPAATLQPPGDPAVGAIESFYISNSDDNTVSQIDAQLLSVGDNAYYWFELRPAAAAIDPAILAEVTAQFDVIYDTMFAYFGEAEPPGGRVHIVHAAPATLCLAPPCGLLGYFSGVDELPRSVNPWSNERAMFVMNANHFGSATYLDTLTHELRHMLGESYDAGEEDWFVEGGATMAEELLGFPGSGRSRGSLFLRNPDQQLNNWTDGNTIPYYGQGYLLNRYLYSRLGEDLYGEFLRNPWPGLAAVDAVATANGLSLSGESVWLDWLVTMALNNQPEAPEPYLWQGPELVPVTAETIDNLPATFDTTVSQYAADYYKLPSSGSTMITFDGSPAVSLFGSAAPSGEHVWYAQRANESNPRLTRAFDLREATAATLGYKVYADIERGYDFAYVAVSTDGGQRWLPLEAEGMQGLRPADDPSDVALADRFYTGRTRQWITESIDLAPYAGEEILLRFEYVTDPILTYGGLAIDDITIPEIGYSDDAESLDSGWVAEGFTRATTELPQAWQVQLVTFDGDGRPSVARLPVTDAGTLEHTVQAIPGARQPILIVSATAPETLQVATYRLELR